jgi:hypothetical protein
MSVKVSTFRDYISVERKTKILEYINLLYTDLLQYEAVVCGDVNEWRKGQRRGR